MNIFFLQDLISGLRNSLCKKMFMHKFTCRQEMYVQKNLVIIIIHEMQFKMKATNNYYVQSKQFLTMVRKRYKKYHDVILKQVSVNFSIKY